MSEKNSKAGRYLKLPTLQRLQQLAHRCLGDGFDKISVTEDEEPNKYHITVYKGKEYCCAVCEFNPLEDHFFVRQNPLDQYTLESELKKHVSFL